MTRLWIDIAGVAAAVLLFAMIWLPTIGVFGLQPYALWMVALDLIVGVVLLIELIAQGKRRLWLLLGIILAFYVPAMLVFAFGVACPMGWALCDF